MAQTRKDNSVLALGVKVFIVILTCSPLPPIQKGEQLNLQVECGVVDI